MEAIYNKNLMNELGKFFVIFGAILILIGMLVMLMPKLPAWKLPGDILIKKDNFILYIPIATSIIASIILTIILNLLLRK